MVTSVVGVRLVEAVERLGEPLYRLMPESVLPKASSRAWCPHSLDGLSLRVDELDIALAQFDDQFFKFSPCEVL
jgi:hypothetical protein